MSYTITLTEKEIHAIKNGMFKYLIEGCDKDGEDYTDETQFKLQQALDNPNIISTNAYEDKIKELKEQNNIYIQLCKTLQEENDKLKIEAKLKALSLIKDGEGLERTVDKLREHTKTLYNTIDQIQELL